MKNALKLFFSTCLILLVAAGCDAGRPFRIAGAVMETNNKFSFCGVVYETGEQTENKPIEGVKVVLMDRDREIEHAYTDKNGRFEFNPNGVPSGSVYIVELCFIKDSYISLIQKVPVEWLKPRQDIKCYLSKEGSKDDKK